MTEEQEGLYVRENGEHTKEEGDALVWAGVIFQEKHRERIKKKRKEKKIQKEQ